VSSPVELVALVRAAHAPPTVAVTALGTVVAASTGRGFAGCVLVAATLLAGQLSIGWSNDVIDAARDVAAGRLDKPIAAGEISKSGVAVAAAVAVALCVPLSLANGWRAGLAHLVVVAGGWAYNLGLKRTAFSWLPYAVSFGALPAFLVLGLPGSPSPPPWVLLAGALLGVGAHFLNVLPDLADDLAAGIRGLPHRIGERAARAAGAVLLAAAAAAVTVGPPGPVPGWAYAGLTAAVVLAAAAALLGRAPGSRAPFLLALLTAAVAVGLLVGRGSSLS
jgi:4-hydroxybenzoate polyprenyltransferase